MTDIIHILIMRFMRKLEYNNKLLDLIWNRFEALANPIRLRIIIALNERPMCVCELSEYLSEKQPLISQHLSTLRDSRLVDSKRIGNRIQYSISDKKVVNIIKLMADITVRKLKELQVDI